MSSNLFFNAHHSPVGSFSSFTLGFPGAKGGLGLELGGPANENVFIGLETRSGKRYEALPFFQGGEDESKRFDVAAENSSPSLVSAFPRDNIRREFKLGTDTWRAGDLTFTLYSPVKAVPDPAKASRAAQMEALVPAVFAELTIDNTASSRERRFFFGYQGSDPYTNMRFLDGGSKTRYVGVGQGLSTAIVTDAEDIEPVIDFNIDRILARGADNPTFNLGGVALLRASVPAGKKKTYRFAICFHRTGIVTTGIPCSYYYTKFFKSIEEVARYALKNWSRQQKLALKADRLLETTGLSEPQQFTLAHAARSYCGSTEYLVTDDEPFWVVNEGEYRMMNTFDLTVDHTFFELRQNPWVVRNQLEWFCRRFSYRDRVRLPGSDTLYPGGISFTHDMGVANVISPRGHSVYEMTGLEGCFSQMTQEELVNWILCGVSYVVKTGDRAWLKANLKTFLECLTSLVNRDHPDPSQRDGVMSADSSRCAHGQEITTYDSLDASLGQSRNNVYLAVKTWAAYVGLRAVLKKAGQKAAADLAHTQAHLVMITLGKHAGPDGALPAIIGENNDSRIIPAIEGLAYPSFWDMSDAVSETGEFGPLVKLLKRHLEAVLVKGTCLFPTGGWKLSSANDNSWLSKIYLCQYVARKVFGLKRDDVADRVHQEWLTDPKNSYWSWSDQIWAGVAKGSRYYPRGVTSWLWLDEAT